MKQFIPLGLLIAALPYAVLAQSDSSDDDHSEDDHAMEQLTVDNAPARADVALRCGFTSECYETEACADTSFAADLSGKAGGLTPQDMIVEADLIGDAETIEMLGLRSTGVYSIAGGSFDARHLLTIAASGDARYTVHLADGPVSITYHGTCEEED